MPRPRKRLAGVSGQGELAPRLQKGSLTEDFNLGCLILFPFNFLPVGRVLCVLFFVLSLVALHLLFTPYQAYTQSPFCSFVHSGNSCLVSTTNVCDVGWHVQFLLSGRMQTGISERIQDTGLLGV